MMNKIIGLLVSACVLAACQTAVPKPAQTVNNTASAGVAAADAQRLWQLSELPRFAEPQLRNTVMDWRKLPQAHANMGCNQLNFQVDLDNAGGLKVGGIAATRMYCAESMALEDAFTQTIGKMNRYRVENGNTLILNNQAGVEMRFIAK